MDVEEDVLLKTHLRKSRYIENVALLSTCDTVRIIEQVTARKKVYGRFTKFIFHSTKLLTTISATSNCAYISVFCQPSIRESVVQVALIFCNGCRGRCSVKDSSTQIQVYRKCRFIVNMRYCENHRTFEESVRTIYEIHFLFHKITNSNFCLRLLCLHIGLFQPSNRGSVVQVALTLQRQDSL